MNAHAFDVSVDDFQQVVIEGSRSTPVVVDFWAPWCGPCRTLKPMLEKLAEEFQGRFILAKINADENQELAAQFGVRGIPDVKAVVDGKVVDGFSGAQPESAVRAFLQRLLPSPAEKLREEAAQLRAGGDLAAALKMLGEASQLDMSNEAVRVDAAAIMLELGQADEAARLLDSLGAEMRDSEDVQRLRAKLSFAQRDTGDLVELRARVAAAPNDMQARYDLANALIAAADYPAGLDVLLEMVQLDKGWEDSAARKQMLAVFNLLGAHPLVPIYRRRLASALN